MDYHDTQTNWHALCIAILRGVLPELAFELLEGRPSEANVKLTKADNLDMAFMRAEGETYRAIGEIYGLDQGAVFRRIKRVGEG